MPADYKIVVPFKDAAMEQEVKDAFLASFAMPKNEDGTDKFTPEQFVKHHLKNFIRSVVNEHREKVAQAALVVNKVTDIEA